MTLPTPREKKLEESLNKIRKENYQLRGALNNYEYFSEWMYINKRCKRKEIARFHLDYKKVKRTRR